MEPIPYVNIAVQWSREKDELLPIVERVLASGKYVGGVEVDKLEAELKNVFNVGHVVAVNSGTDALMFGLNAVGVGPGDEVITSPLTFCSTVNSIIHVGATPVMADINPRNMNIGPQCIEDKITDRTKCIIPVHFAGRPCDMKEILGISSQRDIFLVEDCAHAIETMYHGKSAGTFGDLGCFSFYATKNVVTGEFF